MNEQKAVEVLKEVKDILDSHGIKFWLNYGTLLGAIQKGKFFEWDIDIDISTWYKNINILKIVAKTLDHLGYEVTLTHDTLRLDKNNIHIDIYIYKEFKECNLATKTNIEVPTFLSKVIHYLFLEGANTIYSNKKTNQKENIIRIINLLVPKFVYMLAYSAFLKYGGIYYRKAVPTHHFLTLSKINFYGIEFNVPSEPKKYLKYIYGSTWNKQIKDWDVLEGSKKAYPYLHVQCPNCKMNYALETKNFEKTIKIKCRVCNYKWIEKVFVVWTINSIKYNPLKEN